MSPIALLAAGIVAYGTAAVAQTNADGRLTFGCDDLVVTGRLQTLTYTPIEAEGDLLGHGTVTAGLKVAKLIKGHESRRELTVRYVAHVPMRGDRDFLFILSPASGQTYSVRQAALLTAFPKPRLAAACERTSD